MAQAGATPIQLYYTTTASAAPVAGNLSSGELAININDGKLFYKDSSGVVQVIADKTYSTRVTTLSFGSTGLTPSTATSGAVTVAGTLATTNGGTGLTSFTANQVFYASSTSAVAQSTNLQFNGTTLTLANDALVNGLTVGRGGGAIGSNTVLGNSAFSSNTSGSSNVAVGNSALYSNTTTANQTAIGDSAMVFMLGGGNTAIGSQAMYGSTTAANNTGIYNVANGVSALYSLTSGSFNVASGNSALASNTTASYNAAYGSNALVFNTTGQYNSAVGGQALYNNTTQSNQTATGYQAMYYMRGGNNTATGYQAMNGSSTPANNTGQYNVASGYQSLYSLTSGSENVANGYQALYANTSGARNTAIGLSAIFSNITGTGNVAVGNAALYFNSTQNYQTATGYQAMFYMQGGSNTASGYQAMYGSTTYVNNTGTGNVAYGYQALYNLTSGSNNIALGRLSGYYLTSGSNNVIIGAFSGSGSFMSGTDSNYVVLSDGAGNVRAYWNNNGVGVFSAAIQTAVGSVSSAATITPTANAANQYNVTALAVPATIAAPSGTPADGQKLLLRLKDNGTARALTWNATYRVIGTTLPTTTVASKTTYVGCVYNSADAVWDVVAVTTQA